MGEKDIRELSQEEANQISGGAGDNIAVKWQSKCPNCQALMTPKRIGGQIMELSVIMVVQCTECGHIFTMTGQSEYD